MDSQLAEVGCAEPMGRNRMAGQTLLLPAASTASAVAYSGTRATSLRGWRSDPSVGERLQETLKVD